MPLEAVREAIAYCQSDPPELRDDHHKGKVLAEAIGMNDPTMHSSSKPRALSIEERMRLGGPP